MKKRNILSAIVLSGVLVLGGCTSKDTAPASSEVSSAPAAVSEAEATTEEPEEEPDITESAIEAYTAFLQEKKDAMDFMPDSVFSLISLNGSETPLLVYIPGSARANGVGFYTFDGEKAELIYSCGGFGTAYYDRKEGILFGQYSGQGETNFRAGKVSEGLITEEKHFRVFNDDFYPELNPDTFEYFEGTDQELSKEEFMEKIAPYLPENRAYKVLSPESLPKVAETENFYGALKMTLAQEGELPLLDADTFFTHLIWPQE